jgi:hypothetical protein
MLIERIKTSLWLPKIIFGITISLSLLAIGIAYALITMEPAEIISEGTRIQDEIFARVIQP